MKILVTGTHFTPAQATIEELLKSSNNEIVYLGRKYTLEGNRNISAESRILPQLGIKFLPLVAGRLQRSLTIYTIPSLLKIPVGFIQAMWYLIKEKPNVILSFGGYIGVPVVISGWLLNIPIIIHEQTLVTGLANKISSYFANKVAVSFYSKFSFPIEKIVVTGNPIRSDLQNTQKEVSADLKRLIQRSKKDNLPILYITGGNQGSHIINKTVFELLNHLTTRFIIIHQLGDSKYQDYEYINSNINSIQKSENYLPKKWFEVSEVREIFNNSELVITRAGINTLLELASFKIPTIVIPLPNLNHDEQVVNAKFFAKLGLAQVLLQDQLTSQSLKELIVKMISNSRSFRENIKQDGLILKDAAERLALETMILGKLNGI